MPTCDLSIVLSYPKLTRSDLAVLAAVLENQNARQKEIAERAAVTLRQTERSLSKLSDLGLIEISRIGKEVSYSKSGITGFTVAIPDQGVGYQGRTPDQGVGYQGRTPDQGVGYQGRTPDQGVGYQGNNGVNPTQESDRPDHDHDDHDHVNHEHDTTSTMLNFLGYAGRRKLLKMPHVSREYAGAWRDWWVHHERIGWGKIKNPAAYAYRQIEQKAYPVYQEPLPEDSMDVPGWDEPTGALHYDKELEEWYFVPKGQEPRHASR